MKPAFRQALQERSFPIGAEIVTVRGIPPQTANPLSLARDLLTDRRVNYISVTDSPGGNPMLPPDYPARQLAEYAPNIIIHLSCKDLNRSGLESQLWRYAAEGFENILALTGDLPADGYPSLSSGVFDIDSVSLLEMMSAMNSGLPVRNRKQERERLLPTGFHAGCAVNPFKSKENELIPQYAKLLKKIRAGAKWIIPQLGYDMRRFADIQAFLESNRISVPLLGNVFVLSKTLVRMFHGGKPAGCTVSDSLLQHAEKYAAGADKGRQFFRELAAEQIAVFKGLGYAGVHLGGLADAEDFFAVIDKANSYSPDDWKTFYGEIQYSKPDEFYFSDGKTGKISPMNVSLFYRFSRLVHCLAFHRGHGLYPLIRRLYQILEKKPADLPPPLICRCISALLHGIEYHTKNVLYGCTDCGDCGLPDTAYLCPMNGCSKNQRNGPCGGSRNGRCEAGDKECIWTIAYNRMKTFGEWEESASAPPICYDASLKKTSAWANLFLDRTAADECNGK